MPHIDPLARRRYQREYQQQKRKYRRALLRRYKMMKGCEQCGYKEHPAALHFDHIDPTTKSANRQGGAIDHTKSMAYIKAELAKCRVLCANCHHVRTYEEKHYEVGVGH